MRGLLILLAIATPAAAENEQGLAVGLGFASFSAPGEAEMNMAPPSVSPDWGTGLFANYERMIGSDLGLRVDAGGSFYRGGNSEMQSASSFTALGDAGLVFRFDVLHIVPYAFAGLGAVYSTGGPIDRGIDYALVVGGGFDWLQSRERAYGVELRLGSFAGDVTVVTVGFRATKRWGFF